MFEKLIESTTNAKENKKQSAYFGVTTVIYAALLMAVMVWSVFSFNLSDLKGSDDLTLESLVAPASVPEPEILQPRANPEQKTESSKNVPKNFDLLRNPVENIKTSTKPPDGVTTSKVDVDAVRDGVRFIVAQKTERGDFSGERDGRPSLNSQNLEVARPKVISEEVDPPPPPIVKKPEATLTEKKPTVVTKGVINGSALKLPKPPYPIAAKSVNASGAVNVQVMIDEAGNVVSAVATSGHPLLRAAAVAAAKQAKFTPTKLSEQPVKVTGVIVYNFVP